MKHVSRRGIFEGSGSRSGGVQAETCARDKPLGSACATKGFAPDGSETIQDELVGTGANGDLRSSTALVWHALLSVGFSCRRPPLGVEDGVVVVLVGRPPPLP